MPTFWENIIVDGSEMQVYSSLPSGDGEFPAVVIAHPASGVSDFTQSIADKLAESGYVAVAMDLFHRVTPDMVSDGTPRNSYLDDSQIIQDVDATLSWMQSFPTIDSDRIGITGFCMGGRIAWLAAASMDTFKVVIPYYGGNLWVTRGNGANTPYDLANSIECPMLFHFGEIDENPSQDDMRKLDTELTRLGKSHEFYTYPGADHAFMDFEQPNRYNKQASDMSWPRTIGFLDRHLKSQ